MAVTVEHLWSGVVFGMSVGKQLTASYPSNGLDKPMFHVFFGRLEHKTQWAQQQRW